MRPTCVATHTALLPARPDTSKGTSAEAVTACPPPASALTCLIRVPLPLLVSLGSPPDPVPESGKVPGLLSPSPPLIGLVTENRWASLEGSTERRRGPLSGTVSAQSPQQPHTHILTTLMYTQHIAKHGSLSHIHTEDHTRVHTHAQTHTQANILVHTHIRVHTSPHTTTRPSHPGNLPCPDRVGRRPLDRCRSAASTASSSRARATSWTAANCDTSTPQE